MIFEKALDAHRLGDLPTAESGYIETLGADPEHIDAMHLLATLYLQQGRADEALAMSERVLAKAPNVADAYGNKGTALQALERNGEAAAAFRRAIEFAPYSAYHHFNLGNVLRADGDKPGAVRAYRAALECDQNLVQAYSNLSATLSELGLFDRAIENCIEAIGRAPEYALAHYNLANAYRESGRFDAALEAYQRTLELSPEMADAACNLGLTLMRTDLGAAIAAFGHALTVQQNHPMARFYQGVAMALSGGNPDMAFDMLDRSDPMIAGWLDSWDYVRSAADEETRIAHDPFTILSLAMNAATLDGLVLEFGVRHGQSIRHIAANIQDPVHGFDSFTGLPAAWGGEPAGVYSTDGELPDVPTNVTLHQGLFEDTLGPFMEEHAGPVRFCNIDCDLYGSTVTVLDALAPRIQSGTVLVFDEYLINPSWRDDEYKAFQEAAEAHGWAYRYLAFGLVTKQAAVVIL